MKWQDKDITTIGDVIQAMSSLDTKEKAIQFLEAYRLSDPLVADENFSYCSGYLKEEHSLRLREWTGVPHPIFGMGNPSPEEAFDLGVAWGKKEQPE